MKNTAFKTDSLIPENMTGEELIDWMEVNASEIHDSKYFRRFSEDERISANEKYTSDSILFGDVEDDVKAQIKVLKDSLSAQRDALKKLLSSIRNGGTNETGKTYLFMDFDARKVFTYDHNGQLAGTRQMLPEERQTKVLSINSSQ